MEGPSFLVLILILAIEVALIAMLLGGIAWWMYRRARRDTVQLKSEKNYLADRRNAYLRFLTQHLRELKGTTAHHRGAESHLHGLERKFIEEEKKHTQAAQERDADIWDLRMASTRSLIELLRESPEGVVPALARDRAAESGESVEDLRRTLDERDGQVERQRQQLDELHALRDAWVRLHARATRDSLANARLRESLRRLHTDPETQAAIESALTEYEGHRRVLDDYLGATADGGEEVFADKLRHARRLERRVGRNQTVVDAASSRIQAASEELPGLLKEQKQLITDLEGKLARAEQERDTIRVTYKREIQRLKAINQNTEANVQTLEKENFRLQNRVRKLVRISQQEVAPRTPSPQVPATQSDKEIKRLKHEMDGLYEQLMRARARNSALEKKVKQVRNIEAALRNTIGSQE